MSITSFFPLSLLITCLFVRASEAQEIADPRTAFEQAVLKAIAPEGGHDKSDHILFLDRAVAIDTTFNRDDVQKLINYLADVHPTKGHIPFQGGTSIRSMIREQIALINVTKATAQLENAEASLLFQDGEMRVRTANYEAYLSAQKELDQITAELSQTANDGSARRNLLQTRFKLAQDRISAIPDVGKIIEGHRRLTPNPASLTTNSLNAAINGVPNATAFPGVDDWNTDAGYLALSVDLPAAFLAMSSVDSAIYAERALAPADLKPLTGLAKARVSFDVKRVLIRDLQHPLELLLTAQNWNLMPSTTVKQFSDGKGLDAGPETLLTSRPTALILVRNVRVSGDPSYVTEQKTYRQMMHILSDGKQILMLGTFALNANPVDQNVTAPRYTAAMSSRQVYLPQTFIAAVVASPLPAR